MRPFDRSGPKVLSRYWVALMEGGTEDQLQRFSAPLEPWMVSLVDDVRAIGAEIRPDPVFVTRLEQNMIGKLESQWQANQQGITPFPRNAPERDTQLRDAQILTRSLVQPVALALAFAFALLGGFGLWQHFNGDSQGGPAIFAPATPAPDTNASSPVATESAATPVPKETLLFDVVLPADRIPTGDGRLAGLDVASVPAQSSGTWYSSCCPGPMVEYVLSGQMTVTSRGPFQVLHADLTLDQIDANVEVLLVPGDTWIARNEFNFTYANAGDDPVQLVEWVYLRDPDELFAGRRGTNWGGPGGLDVTNKPPAFTGDIEIKLRRLNLAPGEGEAQPPADGLRLVVVPNVEADIITLYGDDSFIAVDSGGANTIVYVLDIIPAASPTDLPSVGIAPA